MRVSWRVTTGPSSTARSGERPRRQARSEAPQAGQAPACRKRISLDPYFLIRTECHGPPPSGTACAFEADLSSTKMPSGARLRRRDSDASRSAGQSRAPAAFRYGGSANRRSVRARSGVPLKEREGFQPEYRRPPGGFSEGWRGWPRPPARRCPRKWLPRTRG